MRMRVRRGLSSLGRSRGEAVRAVHQKGQSAFDGTRLGRRSICCERGPRPCFCETPGRGREASKIAIKAPSRLRRLVDSNAPGRDWLAPCLLGVRGFGDESGRPCQRLGGRGVSTTDRGHGAPVEAHGGPRSAAPFPEQRRGSTIDLGTTDDAPR
jgi:hypothetical protein